MVRLLTVVVFFLVAIQTEVIWAGTSTHGGGEDIPVAYFGEKEIGQRNEKMKVRPVKILKKRKILSKILFSNSFNDLFLKKVSFSKMKTKLFSSRAEMFQVSSQLEKETLSDARRDGLLRQVYEYSLFRTTEERQTRYLPVDDYEKVFENLTGTLEIKIENIRKICEFCREDDYASIPNAGILVDVVCQVGDAPIFDVEHEDISIRPETKSLRVDFKIGSRDLAEMIRVNYCANIDKVAPVNLTCGLVSRNEAYKAQFNDTFSVENSTRKQNSEIASREEVMIHGLASFYDPTEDLFNFDLILIDSDKVFGEGRFDHFESLPFYMRLKEESREDQFLFFTQSRVIGHYLSFEEERDHFLYYSSDKKLKELMSDLFILSVKDNF